MRHEIEVEVLLDGGDVTRGVMLDQRITPDHDRYAWVYLEATGRKAWVPMARVSFGGHVPAPRLGEAERYTCGIRRHR
ncbi:hypothetical protein ACLM5J_08215 [Nocardioides sp. Bht2]|uniref:hypothetical protein n=1 Tax=Nocardioides sp. Bht2 TaxID=3392297 RepID=UPI0039B44A07